MRMIAVRDAKSQLYSHPMFMVTDAQAVRAFGDAVNGKDSVYSAHPEDYRLVCLGTFDDVSGVITPLADPLELVRGDNLVVA